jgi:transcriptional regulator with XRE-family HTH domain
MSEFETTLRALLEEKRYSIAEFCREVGLSRQSFYNLCAGVNLPTDETLERINAFLGSSFKFETKRRSKPSGRHVQTNKQAFEVSEIG